MNQQSVSLFAILVNVMLAGGKIVLGLTFNLTALIAEGVHSGLDIISSIVAYFGIKSAQKPVDEKHPYGYYRAETLAGFIVSILLAISAFWILYEGIIHFFRPERATLSVWAIAIMAISVVVNEIMARLKFDTGAKYSSPALIADGEHSRADAIASLGVLLGILLIKLWTGADALITVIIGIYILWESWQLGSDISSSLLDIADPEIEEQIKKISKDIGINLSSLKSRKMGAAAIADIKIVLDPKLKIEEASNITDKLEKNLLEKIDKLKLVNISVESHDFHKGTLKNSIGSRLIYRRGFSPIGPKKIGYRIIIPVFEGDIADEFGVKEYAVIDYDDNKKILGKTKIKNIFYEATTGHGVKFAKAVSADEVYATKIGESAKNNLSASGIKFKIFDDPSELEKIVLDIK